MSEHGCPTCGRVFDTRRGLGVHHSQVHGTRLPNRECSHCESEFYSPHEQKYCSEDCRDEAVSFSGASNPNYDGGKDRTDCEICGTQFEYYESEKPGLYCSECVETEPWRDLPDITGDNNPQWKGGKQSVECDMCGATVERYPHRLTGEVVLCGRDCHSDWLSEAFTGEGHPNWRGGTTGPYGKGWNEVRSKALERDGYACVVCGTTAEELDRNPDAHHVVPVRAFVESPVFTEQDAHTLDNVVSLCPSCHRRAEFGGLSKAELRWRRDAGEPLHV